MGQIDKHNKAKWIVYKVRNKTVYLFITGVLIIRLKKVTDLNAYLKTGILETPQTIQYITTYKECLYEPPKASFISDQIFNIIGGSQTKNESPDTLDEKLREFRKQENLVNSIENKINQKRSYSLGKISSTIGQTLWKVMDYSITFVWDNPIAKQWFLAKESPIATTISPNRRSEEILIGYPYYAEAWAPDLISKQRDVCYRPDTVLYAEGNIATHFMDPYDGEPFIRDLNTGILKSPPGVNVDKELLEAINNTSFRRVGRLWRSMLTNKGYSIGQTARKARSHLRQTFNITRIDGKPLRQVSDTRIAQIFRHGCEKIIYAAKLENNPHYFARQGTYNYRENVIFYVDRERAIIVVFENNKYCSEEFFISCYKIIKRHIKQFDRSLKTNINIGKNVTYHQERAEFLAQRNVEREARAIHREFYATLNPEDRLANHQIRLVQNRLQGRDNLPPKEQDLVQRYLRYEAKYKDYCKKNNIPVQEIIV